MNSKVYCKGILCRLSDRLNTKCAKCGLYICGLCQIRDFDKKIYCTDCYVESYNVDWDNINKELELILNKIMR